MPQTSTRSLALACIFGVLIAIPVSAVLLAEGCALDVVQENIYLTPAVNG